MHVWMYHVCLFVHVWMCGYLDVCGWMCGYLDVCGWMCGYLDVCVWICGYLDVCVWMCGYLDVCVWMHVCVLLPCVCACLRMYAHSVHARMNAHI
jgi:nuclear pore complex protein Nup62